MNSIYVQRIFLAGCLLVFLATGCEAPVDESAEACKAEQAQVAANIEMYSQVWDDIINKGELDLFNAENFTEDIIIHSEPENIVGIEAVRDFYGNYITGFSDIEFTVLDVFGQGNKVVKHWSFKGTHTGDFFGIPASGRALNIDGVTLVRMEDGRIAEERDFMDTHSFMVQLGLLPAEDAASE